MSGGSGNSVQSSPSHRTAASAVRTSDRASAASASRDVSRYCSRSLMKIRSWKLKAMTTVGGNVTGPESRTTHSISRVAHPFAHFAKGWGIAHSATALLCMAMTFSTAHAQSANCGLTSIQESTPLAYPPIAKAAHVHGHVVLMASFGQDGTISSVRAISGPPMLYLAAVDFVKSWRANRYTGPRECPVVVHFLLGAESDHPKTAITRIDLQHVEIVADTYTFYTNPNYSIASK